MTALLDVPSPAAPPKPKRPLSAAERAARKANAQHATGPKTAAGKERSRRNGLKHGYRAETCLVAEDEAELQRRLAGWEHDLNPAGPAERWLVARAALATVKLDRMAREDEAALAERRRNAVRAWDKARAAEVAGHAARLDADPAGAVAALLESSAGCAWLAEQWQALAVALDLGGRLTPAEIARADALAGGGRPDRAEEGPLMLGLALLDRSGFEADLRELALLRRLPGLAAPDFARRLLALLPAPSAARARLEDRIAAELADLEALGTELWDLYDGPARAAAPDRVFTDPTPEAARRRRYEVATERLLHRALDKLERNRKSGDLWRGLDAPPEPTPTEPGPAPTADPAAAPTEPGPPDAEVSGAVASPPTRPAWPAAPPLSCAAPALSARPPVPADRRHPDRPGSPGA